MVWRVGPVPCGLPVSGSSAPYLSGLGDTAVDFDIAPPRVVANGVADESVANRDSSGLHNSTTISVSICVERFVEMVSYFKLYKMILNQYIGVVPDDTKFKAERRHNACRMATGFATWKWQHLCSAHRH